MYYTFSQLKDIAYSSDAYNFGFKDGLRKVGGFIGKKLAPAALMGTMALGTAATGALHTAPYRANNALNDHQAIIREVEAERDQVIPQLTATRNALKTQHNSDYPIKENLQNIGQDFKDVINGYYFEPGYKEAASANREAYLEGRKQSKQKVTDANKTLREAKNQYETELHDLEHDPEYVNLQSAKTIADHSKGKGFMPRIKALAQLHKATADYRDNDNDVETQVVKTWGKQNRKQK